MKNSTAYTLPIFMALKTQRIKAKRTTISPRYQGLDKKPSTYGCPTLWCAVI